MAKGGEGRENLMQHRMCIVGSKAKTEGSSLTIGTERVLQFWTRHLSGTRAGRGAPRGTRGRAPRTEGEEAQDAKENSI